MNPSHKHIVFTVTNDLSYDRRMQRICKTLSQNGWRVTLIGRKLPSSIALTQQPYHQKRIKCFFNKGKLFYLEYNLRLFFTLLSIKAEIFSAVDLDTIIPIYYGSVVKRCKRVFDAHEYFEEVPEVTHRQVVKKIWQWVAHRYIVRFNSCYTVNESLAEIFTRQYKVSFNVIRNVPNLIVKQESTHKRHLLYQGALNEGRGLEALITAMQNIDIPLKIIGEGDLSLELRKLVKQLELNDKIEFLGFVEPEKLSQYTQASCIGFNLLEDVGLSYHYSLANKFFDYIQAEIPSISMDLPEYRRINEQFEVSILIESLSPQNIQNAVEQLLRQQDCYDRLKQQCAKAKLIFNWEIESAKLLRIYNEI